MGDAAFKVITELGDQVAHGLPLLLFQSRQLTSLGARHWFSCYLPYLDSTKEYLEDLVPILLGKTEPIPPTKGLFERIRQ